MGIPKVPRNGTRAKSSARRHWFGNQLCFESLAGSTTHSHRLRPCGCPASFGQRSETDRLPMGPFQTTSPRTQLRRNLGLGRGSEFEQPVQTFGGEPAKSRERDG